MPGNLPPMTDLSTPITTARPRPLLRTALKLDAVVTGANGAAVPRRRRPARRPAGPQRDAAARSGAFLLAFAAVVWLVGSRSEIPRGPVYAIVVGNAIWAADSLVAALAGWGDPTTAGTVWIVMQAVVVAAFAELQLAGLRRKDR